MKRILKNKNNLGKKLNLFLKKLGEEIKKEILVSGVPQVVEPILKK